jgi:hypothetical protein
MRLELRQAFCEKRSGKKSTVFAEFGQRVKSASPSYASCLEGGESGAKNAVDEEYGSDWEQERVPGGDSAVAA